jgi:hypothetical protein
LYFDVPFTPAFVGSRGLYCKTLRTHNLRKMDIFYSRLVQGILRGEVSLYCWPPVWLVWKQLYGYWQFLFLFAKQTNPNQSNRRSMVQWYFPFSIPWLVSLLLSVSFSVLDIHTILLRNQKLYSQHFIFFLTFNICNKLGVDVLGQKSLPVINTITYWAHSLFTKKLVLWIYPCTLLIRNVL